MRSIGNLAILVGMVLLNFLATGVGRAHADFVKTPAPPYPPTVKLGATYEVFLVGATPGVLPVDTVGYEFDLHFDRDILSLVAARDNLVGDAPFSISPLPDGLRLAAMGSPADPDDLISTLLFSADRLGTTQIFVAAFTFYAASGPGGQLEAFPQPPDLGSLPLTVVPEPSSLALGAIAFALLASSQRRRSRCRPPRHSAGLWRAGASCDYKSRS